MSRDFDRKLLFSYFLPFGFIGKHACYSSVKLNPLAFVNFALKQSVAYRRRRCSHTSLTARQKLSRMEKAGYLKSGQRKYGSDNGEQYDYISLTSHSLYLLSGLLDQELEAARIASLGDMDWKGTDEKKELDLLPSPDIRPLLIWLRQYEEQAYHTEEEQETHNELFFEAVSSWDITPMANSINLSRNVSFTLAGLNSQQYYRAYRYTNVNTICRLAGFLSCLDRRPIDTGWTFDGLCPDSRYEEQLKSGDLDIMAYTRYTLEKWYTEHPNSYLFLNPRKSLKVHKSSWENTPAFYGINELPGIKPIIFLEDNKINATGEQNSLQHSCLGVAIGKFVNYLVYHARYGGIPWRSSVEKTSAKYVQSAIDNYAENQNVSVLGAGRTIINAVIFCDSVYHFDALFRPIKNLKKGHKKRLEEFGYPFTSMNIIPVNGSGVLEFRALMLTDPHAFIESEISSLCQENPNFMRTHDYWYPLAYNKKPVLLAYDMDYFRLCRAIIDRRAGMDFYVCCYPEQFDYLRKILPDVEYL